MNETEQIVLSSNPQVQEVKNSLNVNFPPGF